MYKLGRWGRRIWCFALAAGLAGAGSICSSAAFGQSTEHKVAPDGYSVTGRVTGRVSLPVATGSLRVAEPNEIPLDLHGYSVHSVDIDTSYRDTNGQLMPSEKDESDLALLHHPDGTAFVITVPPEPGNINVDVTVYFADGKRGRVNFNTVAVLPDDGPRKFYVTSPGAAGTIYMDFSEMGRTATLVPMAKFGGTADPVHIPLDLVRFKVIAPRGKSASVSVDSAKGEVTAVHLGHALVLATYRGSSALTCINVQQSAADGSDRTVCSELVPPGMTAPASGYENAGPPPKIKVRPQQ
jgi:hypothetical protein